MRSTSLSSFIIAVLLSSSPGRQGGGGKCAIILRLGFKIEESSLFMLQPRLCSFEKIPLWRTPYAIDSTLLFLRRAIIENLESFLASIICYKFYGSMSPSYESVFSCEFYCIFLLLLALLLATLEDLWIQNVLVRFGFCYCSLRRLDPFSSIGLLCICGLTTALQSSRTPLANSRGSIGAPLGATNSETES